MPESEVLAQPIGSFRPKKPFCEFPYAFNNPYTNIMVPSPFRLFCSKLPKGGNVFPRVYNPDFFKLKAKTAS